jgi:AcrR family transcriptional regulator
MARKRFEGLDPETHAWILDAADEFALKGFEGASLNRIIAPAGTSRGSLHYYFEDTTDLFSTVMARATAPAVQFLAGFSLEVPTAESDWPVCDEFARKSAAYLTGNAWCVRLARAPAVHEVGDRRPLEQWNALPPGERERLVAAEMGPFRRVLEPEGAA